MCIYEYKQVLSSTSRWYINQAILKLAPIVSQATHTAYGEGIMQTTRL